MPDDKYIKLEIGGEDADIDPSGQIPTINYGLEDVTNFEQKQSATVFDIELPATLVNDKIHNNLHEPGIPDKTASQQYDNFRPCRYLANGDELLIGNYLATAAKSQYGVPTKYLGKIYGLNGDWAIQLKDKTILDFINQRTFEFTADVITASWAYDGTVEASDYVFAPVRYQKRFGPFPDDDSNPANDGLPPDNNVLINDMRPSLSIYWILWRGFRSAGYRIVSTFMDLPYYRRAVLPWTWGAFDFIDDTLWTPLKFLAAGAIFDPIHQGGWIILDEGDYFPVPNTHLPAVEGGTEHNPTIDPGVEPGTFENTAGIFTFYDGSTILPYMSAWNYPTAPPALVFGFIEVNLSIQVKWNVTAGNGGVGQFDVYWYKNGVEIKIETIVRADASIESSVHLVGSGEFFLDTTVNPGDYIGFRIHVHSNHGLGGNAGGQLQLEAFQLNFIKLTDGSTINLANYPKMNNFNWMDLLRGEIDCFDLEIQTDPQRKEVTIEPMNDYIIDGVKYPGYFNRKVLDYSQKVDLSKENTIELFNDFQRELDLTFKDDGNDGSLKLIQDRNQVIIGKARYLLPPRFTAGVKSATPVPFLNNQNSIDPQSAKENRFYSPTMHFNHDTFKSITGVSPQLIAIIPENISNTSAPASENVFNPKRAYYKGNIAGVGGWVFNGDTLTSIPFMFAVNYFPGGHLDPVFSYSDQFVTGQIAQGWLSKFFIQRMAIYRNGRRYNTISLKLNNRDVMNFLHRESIVIEGIEFFLMSIDQYNPLSEDSTECTMWMFVPVEQKDKDNIFPSLTSLQTGTSGNNSFDLKYWPHLALFTDVAPVPPT